MAAVAQNILQLIGLFLAYIFIFAFVPFWLRGFKLIGENVLDKLVSSFLISHVIIILSVYTLVLAGIFSNLSLTLFMVLVAVSYRIIFKRKQTINAFMSAADFIYKFGTKIYKPKVIFRNIRRRIKQFFRILMFKMKNPIGVITVLVIFGIAAYTRCYQSVANMFYGTSDMYLHTEWTKFFMHNEEFRAGVYPYGFHAVIAFLSGFLRVNVVTVMRLFGGISGMLSLFSLYYLLSRTMKSAVAVNVAIAIYAITDLFPFYSMERVFLALPQEFAAVFLYLGAYFLIKYLKEKQKEDLISFLAAVALTLLIHFFVTFFALLLYGAIFITHLVYVNKQIIIRLIVGVVCTVILAMAPLAAGLIKGIELNGSFGWAVSVITQGEEEEEEAQGNISLPEALANPFEVIKQLYESEIFDPTYNLSLLNIKWFMPYLILAFLGMIAPVFKFRDKERRWSFMAFSCYSLLLMALFVFSFLNIFAVMEYSRLYSFFIYSIPLVTAVPMEMFYQLVYRSKASSRIIYTSISTVFCLAISSFMVVQQHFMPLSRVWQAQYNGAVTAYYNISKEFTPHQWIIVSSMSEYSLSLFDGYHYEMTEFIVDMEEYDKNTEIILDSKDIFIYIEKRPNIYAYTNLQKLGSFEALPELDINDADKSLVDIYEELGGRGLYEDYDANRILQAKALAWAEEYSIYFPNEMSVYYEDDEIIVYHVEQNPYAPNNFAIPYRGNNSEKN